MYHIECIFLIVKFNGGRDENINTQIKLCTASNTVTDDLGSLKFFHPFDI